ncbi:hypothetical protein XH92_32480 [Bradyrhizobium sp. CCBAU 53421]|nr:hypothetical protein XH92_32480 [Bradyrhizobium sp. CCBAU 53421]
MSGEFDEYRFPGNSQYFATDVDDTPPEFETLIGRAAPPSLDEHHRDRFKTVGAKMEQVILAKLRDAHIGTPQLRLHHVRVETTQASREFALGLRRIGFGQVEMQIRHGRILLPPRRSNCRAHERADLTSF